MNRRNILNQVVQNDDEYSWKQLTCTYRPWMVGFKSYGNNYQDAFLLLISFVEIYFDKRRDKMILDFIDNYEEHLEKYLGIRINKVCYNDESELEKKIISAIDKKQLIQIPCDLINLPYNPMYMLEHRYKCIIVKGYDRNRGLLYILDNIHIDYGSSTILTDFVSSVKEMFTMNQSFAKEHGMLKCFYTLEKVNNKTVDERETLLLLKSILSEYMCDENKVIHWEEELGSVKNKKSIEEIVKTLDFKFVFVSTLKKMLRRFSGIENVVDKICDDYCELCGKWELLRNDVLYENTLSEDERRLISERLKNDERKIFSGMIKIIESVSKYKEIEKNEVDEYRVLNNYNAIIEKKMNGYCMYHSSEYKYDTWQMQDNAVQLLIDGVRGGMLETKIKIHGCYGEDIHSGIIIKMKSGFRYLYGNLRGRFIALYCPEREADFEIYCEIKSHHEDDLLKVVIDENKLKFYYMEDEKTVVEVSGDRVESIGLFSKTWEYLEHSVEFYDVKNELLK